MIFGLINIITVCLALLSLFIKTRWAEMLSRITSPYAGVVIASITASLVVRFLISPVQAIRELVNPLTYILASSFPLAVILFSPLSTPLSVFQYVVISASMIISLLGKRPHLSLALSFIFSVFLQVFIVALILAMIYEA